MAFDERIREYIGLKVPLILVKRRGLENGFWKSKMEIRNWKFEKTERSRLFSTKKNK